MCPSYMVTREEEHATRGRARLLFEMLDGGGRGGPITEGWRSEEVLDALDLCLSCKGCTNDCPVNVDMPTLKAEFLSHHYEKRMRPRHAYAFGLIDRWARIGSRAPRLANALVRLPGLTKAAGIAPQRELPKLAPQTFKSWFESRPAGVRSGETVILWPDTFTNHFEPDVGKAAVEVLEAAGFRVTLPRMPLCCGRPLYDYGFLSLARRYLKRLVAALRDDIRAGVPVVGVEPSCVAVFRDELPMMLPQDEDAKRLSKQTFHLAEFLGAQADYHPPQLSRDVLLHGHCHERATKGFEPTAKLLERMGARLSTPDSGCCGMAGAWGYEEGHYDVSVACAERVLLPAVRDAASETLVVTNGFSCRSQIAQLGPGRRALHLAQVMQLALHDR